MKYVSHGSRTVLHEVKLDLRGLSLEFNGDEEMHDALPFTGTLGFELAQLAVHSPGHHLTLISTLAITCIVII